MSNLINIEEVEIDEKLDGACNVEFEHSEIELGENYPLGISKNITYKEENDENVRTGGKIFAVIATLITIKNGKKIKVVKIGRILVSREFYLRFRDLRLIGVYIKRKKELIKQTLKEDLENRYQKFSFKK